MNSIIDICEELLTRIRNGETISNEELDNKLVEIKSFAYEELMGEDL
jgi:hypothetical protein